MLRYCTNCKKEFDFQIKSIDDLNAMRCPDCGALIEKNSRKPVDDSGTKGTEQTVGNIFYAVMRFFYLFYMICAMAGYTAYSFHWDTCLYIFTIIPLLVYLIQFFTRTTAFRTGVFFLPVGAVAGFVIFHTLQGACLGVLTVFLIRHLIRDIFLKFITWLLNLR